MQEEYYIPDNMRLYLTQDVVEHMKNDLPSSMTLNCKTFHIFTYYGLMDQHLYRLIDEDGYEPWREPANWKVWGISEVESLRHETFACYELHRNLCLRQQNYKVKYDPDMGLGLYPSSPDLTWREIYPGPLHVGLFGFIEFIDEDDFDWFHAQGYPSLYEDPENNKGLLYGALYFCNHQLWAPKLQPLNRNATSNQVVVIMSELNRVESYEDDNINHQLYTHEGTVATVEPFDPNNKYLCSQDIDKYRQIKYPDKEKRTKSIVRQNFQSYWVVVLDVTDMNATLNSNQIFANYGCHYE